jgi:hypothetical protein
MKWKHHADQRSAHHVEVRIPSCTLVFSVVKSILYNPKTKEFN